VEDAFLFHEPAGEGEVALPVLHAVVARLELPLEPERHRQAAENLAEDLRDAAVLEDPALDAFAQEPALRHDLGPVAGEALPLPALAETLNDAVEKALLAAAKGEADGDGLAEEILEGDLPAVLGNQVEVELE